MRIFTLAIVGCMIAVLVSSKGALAQGGCQVIVEFYCSSIPGNISVFCTETECDFNGCPRDTKEGVSTNNIYNELWTEIDALSEGKSYEGPYDTCQCTGQVPCRLSALCSGCAENGAGMACKSQFNPFLEFDDSGQNGVTDELVKTIFIGSGGC